MSNPPWYKDGLRFECTQCGDCCTGEPGYVWLNQAEISELAEAIGESVESFEAKFVRKVGVRRSLLERPDGDCVLLDPVTRKCQAYAARPRQCRTWPFWQSNLRDEESWRQTCEVCPGCGHGDIVPVEQILHQVSQIRV